MGMLPHLAAAAKGARLEADKLLVDVAGELRVRESTVSWFENGKGWPGNPDATIEAYAEVTGQDPFELWIAAIARWSEEVESVEAIERAATELAELGRGLQKRRAKGHREAG